MSVAAREYYQHSAERLGVSNVPDLLQGQAWGLLTPEDQTRHLSLQSPNPHTLAVVSGRYKILLESLSPYIAATGPGPDKLAANGLRAQIARIKRVNNDHATGIATRLLFPAYLKAGRLEDIRTEAVTRDEVDTKVFSRATKDNYYLREDGWEDKAVLLITSARLRAGRDLGHVAALTVVHRSPSAGVPHYLGAAYSKNDLLAKSGVWNSGAIRHCVDRLGAQDPLVNPVGRGKRPRS